MNKPITDTSKPTQRIVTPEQYAQGYKVWHGMNSIPNMTEGHKFTLIRKLSDGNYLVQEPTEKDS